MAEPKQHIVVFPYMGQGHIIPLLALALRIEKTNKYTITFVNTPLNIKKLTSSLPPDSSIHLLELPFNSSDHGLPLDAENMDSLPYHLFITLFQASMSLKPHFRKLISSLTHEQNGEKKPVCIISDMFLGWCQEISQEFGIFHAVFISCSAFGSACYYSLWLNLPHRSTDSDEFLLPDFPEAGTFHVTQLSEVLRVADGSDPTTAFRRKELLSPWSKADGILFNTVEDIDKLGLMYFSRKFGRQVWTIGPVLLSPGSQIRSRRDFGISLEECKIWLDGKPSCSVLYVSFGSQNTISPSNMLQLAMALEASGKNFIWVLRPPLGFDINSEFQANQWLPGGFEERVRASGRGLLVHKWAPQVEILSHKSLSAFLSHCGWNSLVEALSYGVPILGWPLVAEQFYNVKLLAEEIGVCVEVARGRSCEVFHQEIMEKIDMVMNYESGKGKEIRKKTWEVKEMIKNALKDEENFQGSSMKAMHQFLDVALMTRRNGN
ncbi:UDP-glycosyltransferase 92A1-like [Mangifera indica]|uniref:UDP-glycosyltransferase 92A1-like n=1 Tax=Mangifera indica TaxID=29780 RepID=UPI001CFA12D8|nr:UDP-glycosyltransferase 92A1-like [Mangifera indica]